jgi:L-histidine N-alpha-methyltransferase
VSKAGLSPTAHSPAEWTSGVSGNDLSAPGHLEHHLDDYHRRHVVRSIADGRVPLKFAYVGSAAVTHDGYAGTADYREMMNSALRESQVLAASRRCGPALTQVVDIGPGNGQHTAALLEHLADRRVRVRRYLGVDFSAPLLRISSDRVRGHFPHSLAVQTRLWDVEDRPTGEVERWRCGAGPVLGCLVGHTLGNVEDPFAALRHLALAMRPHDLLLASVLLRPVPVVARRSMKAYRTDAFRRAALEPLLAAGIHENEMTFTVDYRDGAFVGEVTMASAARLPGLTVPRGYRFRCFMSRRFDSGEIARTFARAGWPIASAAIDQDSNHMTVVATRAEEIS